MVKEQALPLAGPSRHQNPKKSKKNAKPAVRTSKLKKLTEKQKIDALEKDAMDFVPLENLKQFADLPLSEATKKGLKKAFFVDMTDHPEDSIHVSLKGKDVLGAARNRERKKLLRFSSRFWKSCIDGGGVQRNGLGALIVSPTRELAVQIFEVLRSIGGYHSFSAGLVIGGKNLKDESDRLSRMNILVATPGRLLQHMDQTIGFDAGNLQMLVLDEADRILDMGFQKTLTALLGHLPKSRQTLLFSATQTESVADLARLSLTNPVQIGTKGSEAAAPMPANLEQHYLVVALDKKLDVLWSFIKTHLQTKIIVFLSSCKQVRFVFETFCKMHPGMPLLNLHGKQKQMARLAMYQRFTAMEHAVLFATDIAARGLDFPSIDWVVQLDAPEDAETYIHRVGRTARYESKGKSLLFLAPSEEEGMLAALKKKNVEVSKIKNRPSKTQNIQNQLQNLAFQDPEIKYLGQRAFVSYIRSIYLQKDKSIFNVDELPVDRFAESLGLPGTPKIKFLSKAAVKQRKNASRVVEAAKAEAEAGSSSEDSEDDDDDASSSSSDEEEETVKPTKPAKGDVVRTKYDRMFERKNQNVLSEHYSKLIEHDPATLGGDDDDDFIVLKRADHDLPPDLPPLDASDLSKRKLKLGRAKQTILKNGIGTKVVFDDAGNPHSLYEMADPDAWYAAKGGLEGAKEEGVLFAQKEGSKMRVADVVDREEAKAKKQEKKRKRKEKERERNEQPVGAVFDAPSDDDGYVSPEFDLPDLPSDDEDMAPPPSKRNKFDSHSNKRTTKASSDAGLDDEEELALRLLGRG